LDPVVKGLMVKALDGPIVQSDETTIQVLKQPGKAVGSDCYMWVVARNDKIAPVVVFNFDPSRSKAVPIEMFKNYRGYLQADGYSGYDAVGKRDGVVRIGCWAHARRKFTDALKIAGDKVDGTVAFSAVTWIKSLYKIEHEADGKSFADRHRLRQEKAIPILREIRAWLDKMLPEVVASSPTGKGLAYMNNEWEYLENYTLDGAIEIDNNFAERAIRPFAIGRRNWMFADTPAGAHASAKLYSIVESAKTNGIDPYEYFKFLLTELPRSGADSIERFMPWNFTCRQLN
jgi:transposase